MWALAPANEPGDTCRTSPYVKYSVRLVRDVVQPVIAAERVDLAERPLGEDRPARVVRRDGHDRSRARSDCRPDRVQSQLVAIVGGHRDRTAAGHLNRHLMVEVERRRQDDLVTGPGDGDDGMHERHVGAGGHHDAAASGDVNAVLRAQLPRQTVDQRPQAVAVLILIDDLAFKGRAGGVDGGPGRRVVHDTLPEGDGPWHLPDDVADDRHDRRLHRVHATLGHLQSTIYDRRSTIYECVLNLRSAEHRHPCRRSPIVVRQS